MFVPPDIGPPPRAHTYTHAHTRTLARAHAHGLGTWVHTLRMAELACPPHVRQAAGWDCGLAVATSVLLATQRASPAAAPRVTTRAGAKAAAAAVYADLLSKVPSDSVWTIDVARLLASAGVALRLYTSVCGINPSHGRLAWYASVLEQDSDRVVAAFDAAVAEGMQVVGTPPEVDYICAQLHSGDVWFVALCDARHIACSKCWLRANMFQFTFAGHYLLLTGYSYATDEIEYMDPAASAARCYMDAATFFRAWHSDGTDDDLIEIFRNGRVPPPV
ncbi:hypothetical protein EON68_03685, partial [archaeon]